MGYVEKESAIFDSSSAASLTSAAVIKKYIAARKLRIQQIQFHLAAAVVSSAAAVVVKCKKYPTAGSSAGESDLGTLTIPAGAAAGKVYYKDISPAAIEPGDEIVFEVTTAAAGGAKAGTGTPAFISHIEMELPANISDMIASA
jgi:hypothetical protein